MNITNGLIFLSCHIKRACIFFPYVIFIFQWLMSEKMTQPPGSERGSAFFFYKHSFTAQDAISRHCAIILDAPEILEKAIVRHSKMFCILFANFVQINALYCRLFKDFWPLWMNLQFSCVGPNFFQKSLLISKGSQVIF